MFALLEVYLNQFLIFVLVLTRMSGLVMLVPVFGARGAPVQVRGFLAIGLSLIIAPVYAATPLADPGNVLNMAVMVAREATIGFSLGLAILILFSGIQLSGQVMSQLSGMSLAEVFDPAFESSVSVFTQILDWVALSIFVCIGGHRHVLAALLDTFEWMPPGHGSFNSDIVEALCEITIQSFSTGIRASAPVLLALMLAVLLTGLVSRTLPQLNVMAIGFNINAFVMLGTLGVTLGAAAWVFQDQVDATLDVIQRTFVRTE